MASGPTDASSSEEIPELELGLPLETVRAHLCKATWEGKPLPRPTPPMSFVSYLTVQVPGEEGTAGPGDLWRSSGHKSTQG